MGLQFHEYQLNFLFILLSSFEFLRHFHNDHPDVDQWQCDFCDQTYRSIQELTFHIKSLHEHGEYECGYAKCSFECSKRVDFYKHVFKKHRKTKQPWQALSVFDYGKPRGPYQTHSRAELESATTSTGMMRESLVIVKQ